MFQNFYSFLNLKIVASPRYNLFSKNDLKQSLSKVLSRVNSDQLSNFEIAVLEQGYLNHPDSRADIDKYFKGKFISFLEKHIQMQEPHWLKEIPDQLKEMFIKNLEIIEWTTGCNSKHYCKRFCGFNAFPNVQQTISYQELRYMAYRYGHIIKADTLKYYASDPMDWEENTSEGSLHAIHALDSFESWLQFRKKGSLEMTDVKLNTTIVPDGKSTLAKEYAHKIFRISSFDRNKEIVSDLKDKSKILGKQSLVDTQEYYLGIHEMGLLWRGQLNRNFSRCAITIACKNGVVLTSDRKTGERFFENTIMFRTISPKVDPYYRVRIENNFESNFQKEYFYKSIDEVLKKSIVLGNGKYDSYWWPTYISPGAKQGGIEYSPFKDSADIQEVQTYLTNIKNCFEIFNVIDNNGKQWHVLVESLTGKCLVLNTPEALVFLRNFVEQHDNANEGRPFPFSKNRIDYYFNRDKFDDLSDLKNKIIKRTSIDVIEENRQDEALIQFFLKN